MFEGEKGTRNLKQDLSSLETRGLILEDCLVGPKTESKSEGMALGIGGVEENGEPNFWKKN